MDIIEAQKLPSIEQIQQIKDLDLRNTDIQHIKDMLNGILIPLVDVTIPLKYRINRARPGRGYRNFRDMTYPPADKCNDFKRCSLPNQTVFYGAIPEDSEKEELSRFIGVCECTKLGSLGIDSVGYEDIAVSKWRVDVPLKMACIITPTAYAGVNNKLIAECTKRFLNKYGNNPVALEYAKFIESEFVKSVNIGEEYNYKISAALSDIILNEIKYDGLVYPSVKAGGQAGMNVAVRSKLVDYRLKMIFVADQRMYKNKDRSVVRIETIYDCRNRCYHEPQQSPDEAIIESLGISSLDELPEVKW